MLKTLRRNGFMPLLVMAQVIFALVVLVNVGTLLRQQLAPVLADSGVPPGQILMTKSISADLASRSLWKASDVKTAEHAVKSIPGVQAVSVGAGLPMMASGLWMHLLPTVVGSHIEADADGFAGDDVANALGLRLLAGSQFSPDQLVRGGLDKVFSDTRAVMLTQSLARQLFAHQSAVGKRIWLLPKKDPNAPALRVVGVVSNTLRGAVVGHGTHKTYNAVILPYQLDDFPQVAMIVRATPQRRDAVAKQLPGVLESALGIDKPGSIKVMRYEDLREHTLHGNKVAALLLAVVLLMVGVVVILGITGLSGFWVQKRIRDIGVRRALGARRGDILRQYQFENLAVVGAGAVIGVVLGLLVSVWLQTHFELAKPSWLAWGLGVLLMLLFGQLAVLGPALRASRVPPVVATRAV
ncbi:FtsX-like permease family protein [Oleiagrimonas sp. C23AA]|uniref:ABC transporter permease n=1 Tax=Oleiagrimonas sp. C23AA TaxID=2719047 RepID=UPI0014211475|nr:FtsX-like permease family protein [Oleiagrimonas sp. C23AA]NII12026.1 FtsX-like permease family protein [Oleiagrimonas sp. C23AA]